MPVPGERRRAVQLQRRTLTACFIEQKLTNSELSQKIKLMTKTRVTELSPEVTCLV